MQYNSLVANSHNVLLETRKLHYLVESELFAGLYKIATPEARVMVVNYVERRDIEAVRAWMLSQQKNEKDYESMTVRALRKEAARRHIVDYNFMTKYELIVELQDYDSSATAGDGDH